MANLCNPSNKIHAQYSGSNNDLLVNLFLDLPNGHTSRITPFTSGAAEVSGL